VLLVDDEHDVLAVIRGLLEHAGYQVTCEQYLQRAA
jgi:CheY-like chemotaxis protein